MRKDWVGLWFVIQAERGHSDEVPFFLAHLREKRFENLSFRHRDKDGVAAMAAALGSRGLQATKKNIRPLPRPPVARLLPLLWRGLAGNNAGGKPNWSHFRPEAKEKFPGFSFLVLGPEAENALGLFLAKNKISLTAYLLSRLSEAMAPELLSGPLSGSWLLPVDMRSAFPGRPLTGNCVSYIKVAASLDASFVHREIKRALTAFEHWSNWWVYHIGKVVGLNGMRKLSLRSSLRTFWLGSFTDLGDWTPSNSPAADAFRETAWAIAAPGTPNNPVGCATLAWFGNRSISLRLHPAVAANAETSGVILRRLARRIAEDTGGREAELLQAMAN